MTFHTHRDVRKKRGGDAETTGEDQLSDTGRDEEAGRACRAQGADGSHQPLASGAPRPSPLGAVCIHLLKGHRLLPTVCPVLEGAQRRESHCSFHGPHGRKGGGRWARLAAKPGGKTTFSLGLAGLGQGWGPLRIVSCIVKPLSKKELYLSSFFAGKPSVRKGSPGGVPWAWVQRSPLLSSWAPALEPPAPLLRPGHITLHRSRRGDQCPSCVPLGTQPVGGQQRLASLFPEWGRLPWNPRPNPVTREKMTEPAKWTGCCWHRSVSVPRAQSRQETLH